MTFITIMDLFLFSTFPSPLFHFLLTNLPLIGVPIIIEIILPFILGSAQRIAIPVTPLDAIKFLVRGPSQ